MYVIINGVSSDTIQGLQVLSLPPITKPKMRRQVDTIDGRDGDIITDLGYEAYDRTITVLLHHNYDLDAITAFFNTSGEIIFSNEPDKIYNFRLLEKIDYERAVKFKTANITFHVQPFKYSLTTRPRAITPPATVHNRGNVDAAPTLTIYGSGQVSVSMDGKQVFQITMPGSGMIAIDANAMDAYTEGGLANRSVIGDYENFRMSPGKHTLTYTGTVDAMSIDNYERWV